MQLLQNCKHCWYVSIQMRYPLFQTTHLQILTIFEKLSKVDRNRSFYIFGLSEYRNQKKLINKNVNKKRVIARNIDIPTNVQEWK